MANQSTILFSPELSERDLDREVDDVNDQLAGVGEDVPVSFDAEQMDMGGLTPAGAGGGGGSGGMGGAAAYGAGRAGGMGALASKIPKPVAGIGVAAALPIALSGAVGVGMLNQMRKSSAMLQTDASLMGVAVDNFFREPGNILSQFVTRPIVNEVLDASLVFDDAIRDLSGAFSADGIIPGGMGDFETRLDAAGRALAVFPGTVGAVGTIIGGLGDTFERVREAWPGWPSIDTDWPGWPEIGEMWPGWPDIDTEWPGWPTTELNGFEWPDIGTPSWPSAGMILNEFPNLNTNDLRDAILGDGTGGGGGGGNGGGGWLPDLPFLQNGGRVQRTGAAVVHRNEIVADPDRLVSELASAVSQSTGGRSRSMDTRGMERRLDRLHDDLRRLESALNVSVNIGREEVARVSADGKRNDISDSNPRV